MTALEHGEYYGLPTRVLRNQYLRLEFLAAAGPRLVRCAPLTAGAQAGGNLLAEVPDFKFNTAYGDFHFRGGHRLWHAPEAAPRTYVPDDDGLTIEETPGGVKLIGPVEAATGFRKSIEIQLQPDRPAVTLRHELQYSGAWPVEAAPWAITQLQLGGIGVLPQPAGAVNGELLPNRQLALWPYASWRDPRLELGDDFMLFRAEARPPFKIGYRNTHGWLGYWRAGVFFLKRFDQPGSGPYPDFGSNAEMYCNDAFFELETLGALTRVEPGQTLTHVEVWEIYRGLDLPDVPPALRARLIER